jgi:hypothetical protein
MQIFGVGDPIKPAPTEEMTNGNINQPKSAVDNSVKLKLTHWFGAQSTKNKRIVILILFFIGAFLLNMAGPDKKSTPSNINLTNASNESGSIVISAISQKSEGGYCIINYEIENLTNENFTELGFESLAKDENGNILAKYPYTEFKQVLPKSKVQSIRGGTFSNLSCQRIASLELTIKSVEIDGNSLFSNPKRVAAFGKIVKGSPNGEISLTAQGGQIPKIASTNNEPKGNLLSDSGKKTEAVSAEALQCSSYEVSKIAAMTAVAEPTFQCSNMIRDGGYSQFDVSTSFANGACFLKVKVTGIINGNSKSCAVSKEVSKVENNRIMFVKP